MQELGLHVCKMCECATCTCAFPFPGINAGEGINMWMHALIAVGVCFVILGSCAIGVNVIHRACGKELAAKH